MKKLAIILAILLALALLAGGLGYYVLVHTAVPFRAVAGLLGSDDGVEIEEVSGSINTGIRIKRLYFRSPEGHLQEFEDIGFSYSGLWGVIRHRELVVSEVFAGRARITFAQSEPATSSGRSSRPDDRPAAAPDREPAEVQAAEGGLRRFEVQRVRLANLTLVFPDMAEPIEIDAVELDDMLVADGRFKLGGIRVAGNALELEDVEPLQSLADETFVMRLQGRALPPLHSGVVQPIPLALEWSIAESDRGRFELDAFDRQLQLRLRSTSHGSEGRLKLIDLTPADWLATTAHWPLAKISLVAESMVADAGSESEWSQVEGGFDVLGRRFDLIPGPLPQPGDDGAPDLPELVDGQGDWRPAMSGRMEVHGLGVVCEVWSDQDDNRVILNWRLEADASGAAATGPDARDLVAWWWSEDDPDGLIDGAWEALDQQARDRLQPLLEPWPMFKSIAPEPPAPGPPADSAAPAGPR